MLDRLFEEIHRCVFGSWSPTIGDPTLMGWATVLAYAVASILAAAVFFRPVSDQRAFWASITVVLVLLTINKQLDLQTALTAIGRCSAKLHGWYDQRRTLQVALIILISGFGLVSTIVLSIIIRKGLAQTWLALFGFGFLMTFVVVRALGFHHFDRFIGFEISGLRMNWILELTGIAMIGLNALILIFRPSKK